MTCMYFFKVCDICKPNIVNVHLLNKAKKNIIITLGRKLFIHQKKILKKKRKRIHASPDYGKKWKQMFSKKFGISILAVTNLDAFRKVAGLNWFYFILILADDKILDLQHTFKKVAGLNWFYVLPICTDLTCNITIVNTQYRTLLEYDKSHR